jgi:molybdopterin synthase catalytic subunit
MDLQKLVAQIKTRPDYERVGMIACHNGVVRCTSRDGHQVSRLHVKVDWGQLKKVLEDMRARPGIMEVAAHLFEGARKVGDDIMLVAVAGDVREHVFPVLEETVERIKKEVTQKEEFYVS